MQIPSNHDAFNGLVQIACAIAQQQIDKKYGFRPFYLFTKDKQVGCAMGEADGSDDFEPTCSTGRSAGGKLDCHRSLQAADYGPETMQSCSSALFNLDNASTKKR
jgi:hypothetical protein